MRNAFLCMLCLFAGPIASAAAPVWAIRGAHNTVYLAGSVHQLPAKEAALPAAFDKAYADADALVMETDLDDMDPLESQGWMLQHGMLDGDLELSDLIGKARYERVAQESSRLGMPVEALERFAPWLVALTFAQLQYAKLGFDPAQGVEMQLLRKAAEDGKEITGLETLEEQLGFLSSLSHEEQAKFLDLTLEEMHEMEGETQALLAAWRTGNVSKLESMLTGKYRLTPPLDRVLLTDRNKRWMPPIEQLLKSDKDYLVVVGTLHLVGPGGLLELVKARGYTARQMP